MSQFRPSVSELEELGWRTLWTFAQAFTGALLSAAIFDYNVLWAAAGAGFAAVLTSIKQFTVQQLAKNHDR